MAIITSRTAASAKPGDVIPSEGLRVLARFNGTNVLSPDPDVSLDMYRNSEHEDGIGGERDLDKLSDSFCHEGIGEVLRALGQSGICLSRGYATNEALDGQSRLFDSVNAAANIHDHSDYFGMSGMGEIACIVAGRYFRMRHQDYIWRVPVQGAKNEKAYRIVEPPVLADIRPDIAALPTGVSGDAVDIVGNTQAKYMHEVWDQNPQDIDMYLAWCEIYFEKLEGIQAADAGLSFRHADDNLSAWRRWWTNIEQGLRGNKGRFENASYQQVMRLGVDETSGEPIQVILQARIMVQRVGSYADIGTDPSAPLITISPTNHPHTLDRQMTDQEAADLRSGAITELILTSTDSNHVHEYRITYNSGTGKFAGEDLNPTHQHDVLIEFGFSGEIPYDKAKALAGTSDATNRFTMVRDHAVKDRKNRTFDEIIDTRLARFKVDQLDRMMELCPGLDGEGSFIVETPPQVGGFAPPYEDRDGGPLNSAYYHRRYATTFPDASGRFIADRFFNDTSAFVALNTKENVYQNVSIAIPIEIFAVTPMMGWNPYEIAQDPLKTDTAGTGSQANPYEAFAIDRPYAMMPAAMYTGNNTPDPADTSLTVWMRSGIDGQPRLCWASGLRPFTPDKLHRTRWPCYPVYQDGSHEATQIAALARRVETLEGV